MKIPKLPIFVLAIFLISCKQPDHSQPTKAVIYREFIDQLVHRGQFNGNVLVAEQGEIIFQASAGLNSIQGDSLKLNSQFRLASVSKQFTCMAIMTLKEAGKINYDDPVQNYVSEWPYESTVRQLMHHTSGAPSYESLFAEKWKPELEEDDTARTMLGNEHMVAFMAEHRPEQFFRPDEQYRYSNTAYVLLATIVARVSGQPFEEYMREHIFFPAGMNETYVFSPLREDPLTNRVYGFRKSLDGKLLVENDYHFLNPVAGDGGIYSTLMDLYSWNESLYSDKIISQETLAEAFKTAVTSNGDTTWYGFGWGIHPGEEWGTRVTHSGGWVGFRTKIERMLGNRSCFIILTNNSTPYLSAIADGIRSIMLDGTFELPKISVAEALTTVVLNEGIEAAKLKYTEFKADTSNYQISEPGFNIAGYQLMREGYAKEALTFFEINSGEFPGSANVWDSLGDGHLTVEDTTSALSSYEHALKIDPSLNATREKANRLKNK